MNFTQKIRRMMTAVAGFQADATAEWINRFERRAQAT